MNRFFLILIFGLLSVLGIQARETIKGMVTDSQGAPLPGVKVEVPGTSQYVFTDLDGAFQIILRDPVKKLNFSYPGLGTTSQRVRPEMTVTLGKGLKKLRNFVELSAGISPWMSDIKLPVKVIEKVWNPLSLGLNYTMGIKTIPQLYAGLGIGCYTAMMNYSMSYSMSHYETRRIFPSLYFPLFANFRWIPTISKKISLFADLKIGYQLGVNLSDNYLYENYGYYHYEVRQKNGLYLQPGIGIRLGELRAFNLGVAYNASMQRDFIMKWSGNQVNAGRVRKNYGFFMVTFGADF